MSRLNFQVITLFPEIIESVLKYGLVGQAIEKQVLTVQTINPRQFTQDVHHSVDDRPFGGGDGMVMMCEPLVQSFKYAELEKPNSYKIYLSPQGEPLTPAKAKEISKKENVVLLCGRYGGVDQRFLNQHIDEEISIGDYVVSGGELPALVLIDASSRFIEGVLGHSESAELDSFTNGLLEHPLFTRPREYHNQIVPEILLSGNHKKISEWKHMVSQLITLKKRPDLLKLNELERRGLIKYFNSMTSEEKKSLGLFEFNI